METFRLKNNLNVLAIQVKTFPAGIEEAFNNLIKMLPGKKERSYYGISYVENNEIIYYAAAEKKHADEAVLYNCEDYTIQKGEYRAVTVKDWLQKTDKIKDVFQEMMPDSCPGKNNPAIEWYKSDEEMVCMVRIDEP